MKNTVTIDINEFDELRKIKAKVDKRKVIFKLEATTHCYGDLHTVSCEYLTKDELFQRLRQEINVLHKSLTDLALKNEAKRVLFIEKENKCFIAETLLSRIQKTWWFKLFAKERHKKIDIFHI